MTPRSTRVAHVWVDDFFVRVERQANPALVGQPVVIGGSPGCPGRVVAASVEAMACGVHPGVTLADAAQLCPEAAFRPGRLDKVLEASATVEEAVRCVAGPVEWCAIDEAVVDLARLDRPRARRMAEDLRGAVREAGHDAAVGVADTRTGARVAARLARPQGVLEVLPGYDGRFLAGLDLACFDDLDGAASARLRAAGIHSLGALANMPPPDLLSVLGRDAQTVARRAAGIDVRPVVPTLAPRRICRVHRFPEVATAAEAIDRLRHLIDAAAMALRRFGCVAGTVTLRIEDPEGGSVGRVAETATATANPSLLRAAIEGQAARALAGRGSSPSGCRSGAWREPASSPDCSAARGRRPPPGAGEAAGARVSFDHGSRPPPRPGPTRQGPTRREECAGRRALGVRPARAHIPQRHDGTALPERVRVARGDHPLGAVHRRPSQQPHAGAFRPPPRASAMAAATPEELEPQIQASGFFRMKSKALVGMAQALVERHGGQVPASMEALTSPARRRTQDGQRGARARARCAGTPVDRHVLRVANRIGIARGEAPERVEAQLCAAVAPRPVDAGVGLPDPPRPPHVPAETAVPEVRRHVAVRVLPAR